MGDTLAVHLDRDEPQSVSVAEAFEATGAFELAIRNHGSPSHVHLRVDDALASVVTLGARNHYVEADETRVVEVGVANDFGEVTGDLEVTTGYGAETGVVEVTVTEPPTVRVDETLSEPGAAPAPTGGVDTSSAPFAGLGLVAVVAVVLAATLIDERLAIAAGLLAVVGGAVAAGYLLASA